MLISVVTSVFNREGTIGQAVESTAAQDYDFVEHIIQDGASTDSTLSEIGRVAGPNVRVESRPDAGIYEGINNGLARATGDIVGLMHSDDFFASPKVLSWVAEALGDPTVDGVYGDLDYVAYNDPLVIKRRWRSGVYTPNKLRWGWMPPHPTLYLRREVFERWGTYDTSFKIAADYDAVLRYLVHGKIRLAYVPEVFVKMRLGGDSNKPSLKLQKTREDLRALRRNRVGGLSTVAMKNLVKLSQFVDR